ncbi:hypothetical protein HWV62_25605 [Athelia sp. TMB]|nr:hypothetical protein HWV62_25605 [Athelia sp. TMB]
MSSPGLEIPKPRTDEGDPMQVSGQEDEEGEGDVIMAHGDSDDSSEEPEEDAEEEKRIREGFIVDEDEEDEEEGVDSEAERRRRRKRRKRRHRKPAEEEEEGLEDDDLELLEENTGASFSKGRLTRLRRGHGSESPPVASSSKRKTVLDSSDDDLDNDVPPVADILDIWNDDRGGDREDEEDMEDFIEYDDEEEGGEAAMDEEERAEKRKEKRRLEKKRREAMGVRPELAGIDANAWAEIHDVFGDGHDYDWALEGDDDTEFNEDVLKPDMKYQDVFEPSVIRARMLTDDDDLIRAQDIPERMQLATSCLSQSSSLSLHTPLTDADLDDAAGWVTLRISPKKAQMFFAPDGSLTYLRDDLVLAVSYALRYLFIQEFEVPYIWMHKRDYISFFDPKDPRRRVELLTLPELWRIYALGQKYRSLAERRNALDAAYARLGVDDKYYDTDIRLQIDSVEVVADATEWLAMKYKDKKQDSFELHFHDDEEQETKKRKMPSRISAYEIAKKTIVSKLADGFGIKAHEVVQNFIANTRVHYPEDQDLNPMVYAEQFSDPDATVAQPPEELLRRARMILSTELGKDPLLRNSMRDIFKREAEISVLPTDRGVSKITEHGEFFNFKYLYRKKISDLLDSPQFLDILHAESQLLVTVSVQLPDETKSQFERNLNEAFASDSYSDNAKAWNEERSRVVHETLENHLIPMGAKWTREWLREEVEDYLAARCGDILKERIDCAPYKTKDMKPGEIPMVLAVSWGKGDPHKDAITLVLIDEAGRLREHTKLDNLVDQELKDEFLDLLSRRKPDVIVIGGFSMATTKLAQRVKVILRGESGNPDGMPDSAPVTNGPAFDIPVIYIYDQVARIYQHSKRATDEFSALSPTAKYCVGLARYTQNPLLEYAALGSDISAISFDEDQRLVPTDKLLSAFERALVDITNKVGVDINRALTDVYYQHLLSFVCGLGPRKAQVLVKKIGAMVSLIFSVDRRHQPTHNWQGGNLVNRDQFIKASLMTTKIYLNAAGFLRISNEAGTQPVKNRHADDDVQDPLDDTRIHPEDYELARKMATDALELDEEDVHDEHPSHVVSLIMSDDDNEKKLNELNLDEFAVNMYEANEDRKRHTLNVIRAELLRPFSEQRGEFALPADQEILTMLSGETFKTLRPGLIINVQVLRVTANAASVRLDSGIDGIINAQYLRDENAPSRNIIKGSSIPGQVIEVKMDLAQDQFYVELSARPSDLTHGDDMFRRVKPDEHWNTQQYERDKDIQARKKRAEVDRTRRVIKHPNFHNFNSGQAETYLDKQERGDVVIRPSSKGFDHLAVTWKVDDKLYQHIGRYSSLLGFISADNIDQ